MRVAHLPVPEYLVERLVAMGVRELYPPQVQAIEKGLLDGRSLVVATPTASGKTLLAALAASKHLEKGGKVVYLTPLRAITSEKKEYFDELFGDRYRVAAVSRDYDQPEDWLRGYDIIVATNEKMESMLRHRAEWVSGVSLAVVDEVHMLAGGERGSTLEVVVTWLRDALPSAQLLALSATVKNVEDIAAFVDADIVSSNWRPVPLREAVYQHDRDELHYSDGSTEKLPRLSGDPVKNLVLNTVAINGQAMVFAGSRRVAEAIAYDVSEALKAFHGDGAELRRIASEVQDGSEFAAKLARCIVRGAAFHHAGLGSWQRRVVENAFRRGLLKAIVATPTLAAGVNLPARAVIIPDLKRAGEDMSVMEYKQLCGRAGRPGYDSEGLAVIVAKNSRQRSLLMQRYVLGELEPVTSCLPDQRRLRFHLLGLVASGQYADDLSIESFISNTLGSRMDKMLGEKAVSALQYLEAAKFIVRGDSGWRATRLGRRVADLYIDPLTARIILSKLDELEASLTSSPAKAEDIALLAICSTPDVEAPSHIQPALDWFREYDHEPQTLAKATVLKAWINEMGESSITDRFGAAPGDMYVICDSASWVAQSAAELATLVGRKKSAAYMTVLSERVKHGVREELLPLVSIPGVGRVRARALYNAGVRRAEDVRNLSVEKLAQIPHIGPETAHRILQSVSMEVRER
ncbi:MAG: DEAD/DEAH box helicase [Candidatus Caldarchaeum sp.]